jgi:hypothetical protein
MESHLMESLNFRKFSRNARFLIFHGVSQECHWKGYLGVPVQKSPGDCTANHFTQADFSQNDWGWPKKSGSSLGLAGRRASHSFVQEHDVIKYLDKYFCTKVSLTSFCGILSE